MKDSRNKQVIFIVDDQPVYSNILKSDIQNANTEIFTFTNGEDCMKAMNLNPSIVVLDFELDDGSETRMNGIAVLKQIKEQYPEVEVIMLSGHEDVKIATTSIKFGAYDYVVKNENALINVKNKMKNIFRKIDILTELKEVNILKRGLVALTVIASLFAYFSGYLIS